MGILHVWRKTISLCVVFALFGMSRTAVADAAPTGFHVSGRSLLDANGNNFIMRGVNHGHNWFPEETGSFAAIKAKGANTVRVVLSSGLTKN